MKYFEQIEAYSSGTMSPGEVTAFEARLTNEADVRKEYEDYKIAKQVSGVLAYDDARQKLTAMKQSPMHVVHRKKTSSPLLRIAAVLLVLIICGFAFSQFRYSDSALADQYYSSASMGMRSPQGDGVAGLIDSKQYEEAIAILQEGSPSDPLSKSLLAEVLTKLKRFPEAISVYNDLKADPQNMNQEGAEFALALVYLESGDEQKASELLTPIAASESHDYRFEARELQVKLQSFWRKFTL